MLTPEVTNSNLDLRLTTRSTSPAGASGFYEIASRLGWKVKRQEKPMVAPLDTDAVYAVLSPPEPIGDGEAKMLLNAVRMGAGLILVVDSGEVLSDSLGLRRAHRRGAGAFGWPVQMGVEDSIGCGRKSAASDLTVSYGPFQMANPAYGPFHAYLLRSEKPLPDDALTFIAVKEPVSTTRSRYSPPIASREDTDSAGKATNEDANDRAPARESASAVMGIPLGRGRVLAVSDPDFLRNDVIRICRWNVGPRMVTALDWVSKGKRPPLVFDEFHQGFGPRPSILEASERFLAATPLGHAIVEGLLAGLLLIIALGVRPIPPRSIARIERRSPLEHVDALAHAYEQVGATRTATRRLVRGLRRRHDRGSWSARLRAAGAPNADADQRFLDNVAAAHPKTGSAVSRILAAERASIPPIELVSVADAVDRVDDVFPTRDVPSDAPPSLSPPIDS
jgi:hypothetical protein